VLLDFLIALEFLPGCVWSVPTACLTGAGAGVDSALEQEKLEARKLLKKRDAYPPSTARIVRWLFPALFDTGGKLYHC